MLANPAESHHVVEGPECRITRLPVGHAEGVLWLAFVLAGPAVGDDYRSAQSRISISAVGDRSLHHRGSQGMYDDGLFSIEMQFGPPRDGRGETYDELSISYVTAPASVISERVDLRTLGA